MPLGLSLGLMRTRSSSLPIDGSPTLVLDFVNSAFETNQSLNLNFIQRAYSANETDPVAPFPINFWVWS